MIRWAVLLASVAFPAWAQDGCPLPSDLERGIVVGYSDGSRTEFRLGEEPGTIVADAYQSNGSLLRGEFANGVHPIWLELFATPQHSAGQRIDFSYASDDGARTPSAPAPKGSLEFFVTQQRSDGTLSYKATQNFGALVRTQLGDCEASAISMMGTTEADVFVEQSALYLPDFGIALSVWISTDGRVTRDRSVVSFERLP